MSACGPEVERRAVVGEALQQRPPVAEPLVEQRRRRDAVLGHVELDARAPRGVLEPVVPERPRVREHRVEVERDGLHRGSMLDSRSKPASGKGTPVQVRDGPAAVRGDASPPHATGPRSGKAVEKGAPSQKTCRSPRNPNPSRKEDSCFAVLSFSRWPCRPAVALVAAQSSAARTAAFPVTIHAANGDVVIKARPTRIVSLSPTATEDLFAVGAGEQVDRRRRPVGLSEAAPRTKLSGFTPNAEAIAAYNPDLVVVSNDGGIVASLQKLGITVLLEPAADNVAQAYDEIRQLGEATGHAPAATKVVRRCSRS